MSDELSLETFVASLITLFCTGFTLTVGTAADGFATMILWGWFLVPALGVKPIGFVLAMGVSAAVGYMTFQRPPLSSESPTEEEDKPYAMMAKSFMLALMSLVRPCLALCLGFIIHSML